MNVSGTRATVVASCVAVLSLGVGIGMVALADQHDSATPVAEKPASTFTEAQVLGMWGADPATAQERRLPWIRLDANRKYAGFDGCNSVAGTWALHAASNTVRADKLITSLVGCPGLPQVSFEDMTFDGASLTYTVAGGATKTMRPVDYDRRDLIRGIDPPTKEWPD